MDNNTRNPRPNRSFLALTLAVGSLILGCASFRPETRSEEDPGSQGSLVFAVFGDSRSDLSEKTPNPTKLDSSCKCAGPTGRWLDWINCEVLTATVQAVAEEQDSPEFSIFLGDIGRIGGQGVFDAFQCVTSPLVVDKQTPNYMVFGNHEVRNPGATWYVDKPTDLYDAQSTFVDTFVDPNWNPPPEKMVGQEDQGLAYAFQEGNSLFIVLDSFYVHPYTSKECGDTYLWKKGYYSDKQLVWLQSILETNANSDSNPGGWAENIFVFSHQPVFNAYGGGKKLYDKYDNPPDNTYVGSCGRPKNASANTNWVLWALMDKYAVDVFFTAHSHFYHRWNVQGQDFEYDATQIPPLPTPLGFRLDWSDDSDLAKAFQKDFVNYPGVDGWGTEIPQVLIGSSGAVPLESCKNNSACETPGPKCACQKAYSYAMITVTGTDIDVRVYSKEKPEDAFTEFDHIEKNGETWSEISDSP